MERKGGVEAPMAFKAWKNAARRRSGENGGGGSWRRHMSKEGGGPSPDRRATLSHGARGQHVSGGVHTGQ
jgi:hypothetical protein